MKGIIHILLQWFSTGNNFSPIGHLSVSRYIFFYYNPGKEGSNWCLIGRDLAKLSRMHRTNLMRKNYLTQNFSFTQVVKSTYSNISMPTKEKDGENLFYVHFQRHLH